GRGVDRSGQSTAILFEPGNVVEMTFGAVDPSVSGMAVPGLGGAASGDMARSFTQLGLAMKMQLNDRLSAALIFDQPFGADTDYPAGTGYYAAGSTAELTSASITALLKYTTDRNLSLFGGLRWQRLGAAAFIPFITPVPGVTPPYQADGGADAGLGYVLGVAWERPDIAARVALTWNSPIRHDLETTESSFLGVSTSTTPVDAPQSLNLELQTGIAPGTLLSASARWVDWSDFAITPQDYLALTGESIVSYRSDTVSYTLGLGRRFSDRWSGAVTLGYEAPVGGPASNLGPTDGYAWAGLGATYTAGAARISAGLRLVDVGDTRTRLGATVPAANFNGNRAVAFGMKLAFAF
ncbi:MAG: hypothetical protein IE927_08535, partial [Rhodobacterales bacterium]|nr:hypothetical protein [Rhodobacterales bacterium]